MGTARIRLWNDVKRIVHGLRPEFADAISSIVNSDCIYSDLKILEWVLQPGECLVDLGKLKINDSSNSAADGGQKLDQKLCDKFTKPFPLAMVWKGCVEVSEKPAQQKQHPQTSYIARAGDLLGVFEVHDAADKTTFDLHACFRSPVVIPPIANIPTLRAWSGPLSEQYAKEAGPRSRSDLFPFVRAKLVTKAKPEYLISGATLLLLPHDFVRTALYPPRFLDARTWLPLSAILWCDVAQSYRYAFLRSQIERTLQYTKKGEGKNLHTKTRDCFAEGDLSNEIVWTAPSPRFPASCGLTLKDFLDREFAPHMQAVQLAESAGPIVLMPAHLHWPEVAWGLFWGQWADRTKVVANNLSRNFRERWHRRSRDGTACTTYPGTEWPQAASLLQELLNFSEPGITLTEHAKTWGKGTKSASSTSRMIGNTKLVFFTKPDVLIDFIHSRLRDLCSKYTVSAEVDAIQHLIQCNVRLLAGLQQWIPTGGVRVLGKAYSTSEASVRSLTAAGVSVRTGKAAVKLGQWESVIRKQACALWQSTNGSNEAGNRLRLVIDDGGFLHSAAHSSKPTAGVLAAGVEQTTSGIASLRHLKLTYPIVNVAQSWVKRRFESPLIAEAVASRCEELFTQLRGKREFGLPLNVAVIGGSGSLGKALMESSFTAEKGVAVQSYDGAHRIAEALQSDVLFGCTGEDILSPELRILLKDQGKQKTLISCSSGDIEFRSLLREVHAPNGESNEIKTWPARDILLHDGQISILRGGFPYNFDNAETSVSLPRIVLTTMLMAAGMFQAASLALNKALAGVYKLSPHLQAQILGFWFDVVSRDDILLQQEPYKSWKRRNEDDWIKEATDAVDGFIPLTKCGAADNLCRELAKGICRFRQLLTDSKIAA